MSPKEQARLCAMLAALAPRRHEGVFVFVSVEDEAALAGTRSIASVREREGLSAVLREEDARARGLEPLFRAAWITLELQSELEAVGLTAAFSAALAEAGIGCNVVAGAHHDHLFVPIERADDAMDVLRGLERAARAAGEAGA